VLIILPGHLEVSGVTTWAMRAVEGLRGRGHDAGLIVHCATNEQVPEFLRPWVVAVVEDAPPMDEMHRCLDRVTGVYLDAAEKMHALTGQSVVVSPNLHGDCYGAVASIAQSHPELIRVVSWLHADNNYDLAVAKHYSPMLHAIVAVSAELRALCQECLPGRPECVVHIAHGVEVSHEWDIRRSLAGRPLRLVYTGRLEEYQKRVSVLPELSKHLNKRGVLHKLRIVGDGPEVLRIQESTFSLGNVELTGAVPPEDIAVHLRWADIWVLPSRYEGQSVAMLEAMAQGCVPVVTRVRSGANGAVVDGESGVCIDAAWGEPVEEIAGRMGDVIARLTGEEMRCLSRGARKRVVSQHSNASHVDALVQLQERVVSMPSRAWPSGFSCAYTSDQGFQIGTVPVDAKERMRACLAGLRGKAILIFGCGQHTGALISVIRESGVRILGIIDDNRELTGSVRHGYHVYSTNMICELVATDIIISSHIHQETIWEQLASMNLGDICVHRLYQDEVSRKMH